MKKTILKSIAIGLLAVLMVFNVMTTVNSTTDTDVSLSGLISMAQADGEDGCELVDEINCYHDFDDCTIFRDCSYNTKCTTCKSAKRANWSESESCLICRD